MGDGLAQQGPSGPGCEPLRRGGPVSLAAQPPTRPGPGHHHAPLTLRDEPGQLRHLARRVAVLILVCAGGSGSGRRYRRGWCRHGRRWFQRLAQGPVEVHRAGIAARRRSNGRLGPSGSGVGTGLLGYRQVDAPTDRRTVETHLVDGLGRTPAPQLRRTVGAAHDHGNGRVGGLHHRGEVVGGRGARGAHQRRGTPLSPAQTESEESTGALIELDPGADCGVGVEAEGQRSRARPGADHRIGDAQSRQPGRESRDCVVDAFGHDSPTGPLTAPAPTAA